MKLVGALDAAGIELIGENAVSSGGGRGVRLKRPRNMTLTLAPLSASPPGSPPPPWRSAIARTPAGTAIVYGACLATALLALLAGVAHLIGNGAPVSVTLPLGLPWLGAHFRLDALSAFFLVVVNLGAAAASLFALGYGRHETAPQRVLPFYPAFLAGMNLVVLADDAFTFLVVLGVHVARPPGRW